MPFGRYTINTNGETIYSLGVHTNISDPIFFKGKTTWGEGSTVGFQAKAILKCGTIFTKSDLWQGLKNPIHPQATPLKGTITIDFYLISNNNASIFIEDETFTHVSGTTVGTFYVSYLTDKDTGFWGNNNIPIQGEDGQPIPAQPYLESGTATPQEEIPYGDPPDNVHYEFSIFNEQPIELLSACGTEKAQAATAQVTVSNGDPSKSYGITLTFTNLNNTPPFKMTLSDNLPDPPSIAYQLFFNDTLVTAPGGSADWDNLSNSTFTKHIYVTGVNETTANSLPQGTYKDIVYVSITPNDTI